jgi:single stranded DNA-binding protein
MNETTMTLAGNLVDDPELRCTPSGQPVVRFRVASTPRYYDKAAGEWKDGDSLFLTCQAWRQLAGHAAESLNRGTRVIVAGRLPPALLRSQGRQREAHRLRARGGRDRRFPPRRHGESRQGLPARLRETASSTRATPARRRQGLPAGTATSRRSSPPPSSGSARPGIPCQVSSGLATVHAAALLVGQLS